jgi:hypothetical protein
MYEVWVISIGISKFNKILSTGYKVDMRDIHHGVFTSLLFPFLKEESMLKKLMPKQNIYSFIKINNTVTSGIHIVTCNLNTIIFMYFNT